MEPTNHLRWDNRRRQYLRADGTYVGDGTRECILQQFFSCGKLGEKLTPSGDFVIQNIVTHAGLVGEWRDIPTVKS